MNRFRPIAPVTAAALCAWGSSSALPEFPHNLPWPNWVNWSAFTAAFATYFLWFCLVAWAITKASKMQHFHSRALVYSVVFLVDSAPPLTPLLPAYGIFGLCRLGLDCGQKLQGASNVLQVAAFELPIWGAMPICLALIGATIQLSRFQGGRKGAAEPAPHVKR